MNPAAATQLDSPSQQYMQSSLFCSEVGQLLHASCKRGEETFNRFLPHSALFKNPRNCIILMMAFTTRLFVLLLLLCICSALDNAGKGACKAIVF
jgi:hypothetical protein